jgi:hypothetical protein
MEFQHDILQLSFDIAKKETRKQGKRKKEKGKV